MSALWQKLKTARNKSEMSVREAWDAIAALPARSGKEEKTNDTLWLFLKDPSGDQWKTMLVKESKKLTKSSVSGPRERPLFRGDQVTQRIHRTRPYLYVTSWFSSLSLSSSISGALEQIHGEAEAAEFIRKRYIQGNEG
eukprot:99249-Pyramimonas_sp.AAC.1